MLKISVTIKYIISILVIVLSGCKTIDHEATENFRSKIIKSQKIEFFRLNPESEVIPFFTLSSKKAIIDFANHMELVDSTTVLVKKPFFMEVRCSGDNYYFRFTTDFTIVRFNKQDCLISNKSSKLLNELVQKTVK